MIEPGDWESATGECLPRGSNGVVVRKVEDIASEKLIAAAPMMKELLLDFCDSLGDKDCIPTYRQMATKKAALALLAEVVQ